MSLNFNHREFAELQNLDTLGRPKWVNNNNKPCTCKADVLTLREASGYSDFAYFEVKCKTCGQIWIKWFEG